MRKIVHKFIPIWKVEEEEKWLNQMANEGWALVSVGFCRFEFERCEPGEYTVRLQLLEKNCSTPDSQEYIRFLEGTGAEHVGSYLSWVYFRKKRSEGEFELFSDRKSRLEHMKRQLRLLGIVSGLNWYFGLYNVWLLFSLDSGVNALGFINLALAALGTWWFIKMYKAYQKKKAEAELFE